MTAKHKNMKREREREMKKRWRQGGVGWGEGLLKIPAGNLAQVKMWIFVYVRARARVCL